MSDERGRHRRAGAQPGLRTAAVQAALDTFAHGRSVALGRPLRVLDLGGGTGGTAVPLAAAGHDVTVVDPSPDALASLARRAAETGTSPRIHPVQGDTDTVGEPRCRRPAAGLRPGLPARHPRGRRRPGCRAGQHRGRPRPRRHPLARRRAAPARGPGPRPGRAVRPREGDPRAPGRPLGRRRPRPAAVRRARGARPARRPRPHHGAEPRRAHLQRPRPLGPGRLRGRPGRPARPRGRRRATTPTTRCSASWAACGTSSRPED